MILRLLSSFWKRWFSTRGHDYRLPQIALISVLHMPRLSLLDDIWTSKICLLSLQMYIFYICLNFLFIVQHSIDVGMIWKIVFFVLWCGTSHRSWFGSYIRSIIYDDGPGFGIRKSVWDSAVVGQLALSS